MVQTMPGIKFSRQELNDLFRAWLILSVAFALVFSGFDLFSFSSDWSILLQFFMISGLTAGLGFIFHELSHKYLAIKYGCKAEFKANNFMLGLALFIAVFFKFILAAPGGVVLKGYLDKIRHGRIAAAGPASNLFLALIFLALALILPSQIFTYGYFINAFLAFFNLLPFPAFDGLKILWWNKWAYGSLFVLSILLLIPLFS